MSSLSQLQQNRVVVGATSALVVAASVYVLLPSLRGSARSLRIKSSKSKPDTAKLTADLAKRTPQALTSLLAAFGPDGANAPGTAAGCMVASPSRPDSRAPTENESYYFQWPRDGGICLRAVIRKFMEAESGLPVGAQGEHASDIERRVKDFIDMNLTIQHTPNRSGTFETGGIGEPKFLIDGSPFEASWGRPQNDGPALRAIAALTYASYILSTRDASSPAVSFVHSKVFGVDGGAAEDKRGTLARNDLDYLARAWKADSFDPWEEVCASHATGGHFYNLSVQRGALLSGARFARRQDVGDEGAAARWEAAAHEITTRLEDFWNPKGTLGLEGGPPEPGVDMDDARNLSALPPSLLRQPHIAPTLGRLGGQNKPCQTDVATLLAFTHAWDGNLGRAALDADAAASTDGRWRPWGERSLASLHRLVDVFRIVYPLNQGRSSTHDAVLCGRYPEDIYDGIVTSIGHPWFLTTHVVAEILALTAAHHASLGSLEITHFNAPLYARFGVSDKPRTLRLGDPEFERALHGLRSMADAYLALAGSYAGPAGRMDEQITRTSGQMRGARELSWSYASLLSAVEAREGRGAATA